MTKSLSYDEFHDLQDQAVSPDAAPTFGEVLQRRHGRRDILRGVLTGTALAALMPALPELLPAEAQAASAGAAGAGKDGFSFAFPELERGVDATHHVAKGYDAKVLIRWGDPLFKDSPAFDPYKQTAESQKAQFGYNNDFLGFLPLPQGSSTADHGLLWANHEYTNTEVMFPGLVDPASDRIDPARITKEIVAVEMAAHGGSVVEIRRGKDGAWTYVKDSPYNRRITALETAFTIAGPAAGHRRMKTKADPDGRTVIGMINNCAGGVTPWGTILTCEENIDGYFMGAVDQSHPEQRNYDRMTVPSNSYQWGRFDERFNVNKEPFEANRFGWLIEIDPYDPKSTPRKHTALGRFKHEGAGVGIGKDGRVAVYMGDDQRFEHIYRFVSKGKFNPKDRAANMKLLEEGTLSVARFDADGGLTWLPLVHGQGPLTKENGFNDQGDVVIMARIAATLVGATRMDRPEDIEVNQKTNAVYAMLTNNEDRKPADYPSPVNHAKADAANPRGANIWGHIVEMMPPDGDHTADRFTWNILVKAGNPADPKTGASFNEATTANGWFSCPDNCAVDHQGRLWIATDQGNDWKRASGSADGIWALETQGPMRGTGRLFFRVPVGAEMCGPIFTPDDGTLFVAVQHPGVDGVQDFTKSGGRAKFEDPGTRWPDFDERIPPRPSVVAITKQGGGAVGV